MIFILFYIVNFIDKKRSAVEGAVGEAEREQY
jgi:hypothetical protein